jgi:hypothetical protein
MQHWRRPTTISISLFLLFTLFATFNTAIVRADDDDTVGDEYEETARVARVSLINGDVQLRRSGSEAWESVRVNLPLVEGDELATTGQDARLEIQIDARNFVRVGGDSILRVVSLRDEGIALSLSEGTAILRLARFDHDKEYFEIDAPGTTLAAEKPGVYRLDVSPAGSVRLTARDGGQARIYSETSGFTLRDGRSAELVSGGTDAGDWELSRAVSLDSWDTWVNERERELAERLRYDDRDRYYDREVWGAEELDAYGDWTYANEEYGWVWRPRATVVNNYHDWAPYRHGQWSWVQPYGWTWVGDEPWGWAPYHYGRWVYHNNSWGWAPRGYGYKYRRAWWRPALVVFVYIPTRSGEHVAWYPLSHGQRDPRGRHYGRFDRRGSHDVARLRRNHPEYFRAITTLPTRQFGRRGSRGQRASTEVARRAFDSDPVRGRLPITPTDGAGETGRRAPRIFDARRGTSNGTAPAWRNRPTGAGRRTPGVALDGELRRSRVFRGREPRGAPATGENNGGGIFDRVNTGDTGAVARPSRRRTRPADGQPVERGASRDNGNSGAPSTERPARPPRNPGDERRQWPTPSPNTGRPDGGNTESAPPTPRGRRGRDDNDGGENEGRRERRREPRSEPGPETQPEPRREPRSERRPERRPEPRPEAAPESRPEPRSERRSEPRSEPRPERRPEPRPEPRPETRPEPRPESRPEPRPAPPPQRGEEKPATPQRERKDDAPREFKLRDKPTLPSETPSSEQPN